MIKSNHARLMAAATAAIALHALLLIEFDSPDLSTASRMHESPLNVTLLSQQQSLQQKPQPKAEPALASETVASDYPSKKSRPEKSRQREVAISPETSVQYHNPPSSLPDDIEADILANVVYPRKARRRGWEGDAEFKFSVNRQSVQDVTMLISTGYPILDQAARSGLLAAHSLPLRDGSYRLPVVFRLQ